MKGVSFRVVLVLLALAFVASRLAVLATSLELFDPEEAQAGTMGMEALRGFTLPPFEYVGPPEAHEGGMLANALLIAASYAVFGTGGFSLKLTWLAFSLGAVVFLAFVVRTAFGVRSAAFFALLAVASPPFFTFMNLTDTAVDSGALFFSTLVLFLTVRALDRTRPRGIDFAVLGVAAGYAPFFSYHTLTMIAICLTLGVLPRIRRLARFLPALVAGGLVGLTPWIAFNATHDFWGIGLVEGNLHEIGFLDHLSRTITTDLRGAFGFSSVGPVDGVWLGTVYYAACAAALPLIWVTAIRRRGASVGAVLVAAFPVVFVGVYAGSSFAPDRAVFREYRHFLNLIPYLFVALAVAADRLLSWSGAGKRAVRSAAAVLLAVPVACGALANAAMIEPANRNFGPDSMYPYRDWHWLAFKVGLYADAHPDEAARLVDELARKYAPYDLPREDMAIRDARPLVAFLRGLGPEDRAAMLEGVGIGMGRFAVVDPEYTRAIRNPADPDVAAVGELGRRPERLGRDAIGAGSTCRASFVATLPPRYRIPYCRGLGAADVFDPRREGEAACRSDAATGDAYREGLGMGAAATSTEPGLAFCSAGDGAASCARGSGIAVGVVWAADPTRWADQLAATPAGLRGDLLRGVGIGLGWHLLHDPTLMLRFEPAWRGSLRPSDVQNEREYSYLPGKVADLLAPGRDRSAFLRGLGRGYAPFLAGDAKLVIKVIARIGHDPAHQRAYCDGLAEGLRGPEWEPARAALAELFGGVRGRPRDVAGGPLCADLFRAAVPEH
jgi:hypothetical protein